MTMSILRRVTDVVRIPATPSAVHCAEEAAFPLPLAPSQPAEPRSWTPGICHHDSHATWRGVRYGLLFLPDDLASVLPCPHRSRDGA